MTLRESIIDGLADVRAHKLRTFLQTLGVILGVASLAAAVNFFVTIINMRAKGMTMMRMPMFVWMSFITQILLLLAFPVIAVAAPGFGS